MASRHLLSHIAILLIILGIANKALDVTAPVVDPTTMYIVSGFTGGIIYAFGVVSHRLGALEPEESLAAHYANSFGKHILSDILGMLASMAFIFSAVGQMVNVPTVEILMLMVGVAGGSVLSFVLFIESAKRSRNVYVSEPPMLETDD